MRQELIHHGRVNLRAGDLAGRAERRDEDVVQAGGGDADEDDGVLEDGGVDSRRAPVLQVVLRHEQIAERVGAVGRRAVGLDGRSAEADQRVQRALGASLAGQPRHLERQQRQPGVAGGEDAAVQPHRRGRHAGQRQVGGHRQRRDRVALGAQERRRPAQRPVGVEHEQVVSEAARGLGQRLERRADDRPLFERAVDAQAGDRRDPADGGVLAGGGAGVGGLGQQHDVAGLLDRLDEDRVRFGAGPRVAADVEPGAAIRLEEADVVGDDRGRAARQVVDQPAVEEPRPRPASGDRLEGAQRLLVDLDDGDPLRRAGRRDGPAHPQVVDRPLERLGDRQVGEQQPQDRGSEAQRQGGADGGGATGSGRGHASGAGSPTIAACRTLARSVAALAVAAAVGIGVMAVAGAQSAGPLWQVRHAGDGFDDGRVAAARDLDHPATFTPAFATKAEWMARAETLRRQVRVALGLWPWPERTPLNAVVRGRIVRDGYTIEHVAFESVPGHWVTGSLYRPTGRSGRLPAVLAPHGHWPGGRHQERSADDAKKEMASGAEQTIESARYPLQARPAMLARMGVIAFAWDMVGYADSTAIEHRAGFTDADAELRLQSFLGLSMWNAVRAVDFLLTLPDVDPARIGINGASGGGTQSLLLAAIDDRVATAVPAVMVSGNMQGGCICENATLMRLGTNNIELTALAAPRPLAAVAANDWTTDFMTKGLPELKTIYALMGAPDAVAGQKFEFPHNDNQVSREYAYAWFNRVFKLGLPEPVRERPFVPVPPAQLHVFDAAHPRPASERDAAGVRRAMTESSDRQLKALAAKPAELAAIVRGGFETAIADRLPARVEPVQGSFRSVPGRRVRRAPERAHAGGQRGPRADDRHRAGGLERRTGGGVGARARQAGGLRGRRPHAVARGEAAARGRRGGPRPRRVPDRRVRRDRRRASASRTTRPTSATTPATTAPCSPSAPPTC